ncbi:MAG: L-seryl-tRNA(Sec) selenium transferase [Bacillota bacterium]
MDLWQQNRLRQLPSVDEVMRQEKIRELLKEHPRSLVLQEIRTALDAYREKICLAQSEQFEGTDLTDNIIEEILTGVLVRNVPNLRPVINATGVVLHTNLGRSVLSEKALQNMLDVAGGYCNLELDLATGERGSRYAHVAKLVNRITGGEACLVVNNNAAAVLLALSTMAKGMEVPVSRGQLVEIGGSFRVPEVMAQSGARLVEVGSTNKTYSRDYERAIGPETALLLKVHTSNYRMVGFTHETTSRELVELGQKYNLPVMEDLGSGFLTNLSPWGIDDEPTVQAVLKAGVDVVTFSGDKLLGGPQAGIIVGRREYIERMKVNPLTRAIRIDKMTLAALEATLRDYLDPEKAIEKIPTLRILTMSREELRKRARSLRRSIVKAVGNLADVNLEDGTSQVGGGALPATELPTTLVVIRPSEMPVHQVVTNLRQGIPAVMARIHADRVILDPRTIMENEFPALANALKAVLALAGKDSGGAING